MGRLEQNHLWLLQEQTSDYETASSFVGILSLRHHYHYYYHHYYYNYYYCYYYYHCCYYYYHYYYHYFHYHYYCYYYYYWHYSSSLAPSQHQPHQHIRYVRLRCELRVMIP